MALLPPVATVSSIFAGLKDAKMRVSANYVRGGHYLMRYDKIKVDINRKKETFMVFEMTVVKVIDSDSGRGHRVGESVSHMLMAANDCFLGNVKTILANVCGLKPEEIQAEHAETVCAADQPLAGSVVEIKARQIMTKKDKAFTEVNHYREIPPEELLTMLDETTRATFFPGDVLNRQIAARQAAMAAAPAA